MTASQTTLPTDENQQQPRFSLRLLGSPLLQATDGRALPGLGPGKSLAMLAYLAVRGPARRDELISMLWGEIPEEKARNAFRQSLHRLRAILGDDILPQDRDQVAMRGGGLMDIDRDAFVAACDRGRWSAAIERYSGEFMEGFESGESAFDRWADAERVRLRARYQEALLAAGNEAVAQGRISDALGHAKRLVDAAPYDEGAALFEANTLVAAGRPAQAVARLNEFAGRLREELDLPASPPVKSLLDRLERRAAVRDTPPGAAPSPERGPSFVGRAAELSRMLGLLGALKAERGATILLEGESGIGKSRLLDEFADRARNLGGVLILRGREAGLGGVLPYAALAEALRPLVRAAGVAGASRHLLAEAARLLPELRDAFDLPAAAPIEDETGRLRFFEGVAALIDAAAYERPVCLMIDDAQHASQSTADLLIYLSRRLQQSPVLLIIAYRSDRGALQTVDRLRELAAAEPESRIHLEPLDHDESLALARALVEGIPQIGQADIERIIRSSGGRPYAVADLVRRAIIGELPTEVPATLRDVLWARFQTASPSQRRIFFAASLFERSASLRLLAAAAHLPEATAFEAAEELIRAGLLRHADDGLGIAHDTTTSFLVDSSGLAGRAMLAGWAADALAAEAGHSDAELAALYAMAGRASEAFTRARAGAFVAAAMGASSEVSRLLGIALTFAPDETARREIDSLLAAFGKTRLTLTSLSQAEAKEEVAVAAETSSTAQTPSAAPSEHRPSPPRGVETSSERRRRRLLVQGSARQWVISIAISIIVVAVGTAARRAINARSNPAAIPDTLYFSERDVRGQNVLRYAVDARTQNDASIIPASRNLLAPEWTDSLTQPFFNPLASPDLGRVAVQRATPRGAELLIISADRGDTTIVASSTGDNTALDWSPDSRSILYSRTRSLPDGSFDTDLYVVDATRPTRTWAIDTSATRAIAEGKWSPTGAWVAWVARTGTTRQRDVFVARADGSELRNLTGNPADDYDISWSPDGSLLAFTSNRAEGTRVYVYDFEGARLWPVSDRSNEGHAVFSPDGRAIAVESTREGDLAVYVRPALGGTARRVTPRGRQFSVAAWRGGATSAYVDRLRIIGGSALAAGDSARLDLFALTRDGRAVRASGARWRFLDRGVVQPQNDGGDTATLAVNIVARTVGDARVVAEIPGWRADTVLLVATSTQPIQIVDSFDRPIFDARWMSLGRPSPFTGRAPGTTQAAAFPNGDLEWDSGLLLRQTLELRPGLRARLRIYAPFVGRPTQSALTVGFVAANPQAGIDSIAPRFTTLVSTAWEGASGNLVYSVGREASSDAAAALGAGDSHEIEIRIDDNRAVVFSVDGRARWTSSLNFLGDVRNTPVRFWIGGRATGALVAISEFALDQPGRSGR